MQNRNEKLSETKLNSVNLFKAINKKNEHALSLCNYYIGLIDLESCEFEKIYKLVRKILMILNVHMKPACKERLYLPRNMFGRGLISITFKAEKMLLDFKTSLERRKLTSLRSAGILWAEQQRKSHMATITEFLRIKYESTQHIEQTLKSLQIECLLTAIKKKTLHSKLFESLDNETFNIQTSSK
ncbi:uncharacterized protein LOC115229716 [Octopus sinensis]|uniref:Uncharacterized protein LOC115229716 n=1 Tax=Octopus sinensis TaxID=2607531 RepID=A0A6P7U4N3_9MOLL|nr:uncharacterized protein LOC115229716 [Octopus sinensis]